MPARSVSDVSDPNIWLELVGRWLVDITTADTLAMLVSIAHKIASSIQEWKHTLVEAGADRKALAKLSGTSVCVRAVIESSCER